MTLAALTPNVQPFACSTVTVCPAIVSDALRAGPGFAATENCTWPLPLPVAPLAIVTHEAPLAAVHAQPPGLVTWTVPVFAAEPTLRLVALTPNEQSGPCVTVTA